MRRLLASNAAIFVLSTIVFSAAALQMTPRLSADSRYYLSLSDEISRGNAGSVFGTTERASWTVIVLPLLISLARAIAPDRWMALMVAFNVLCAAAATAFVVAALRMLCVSSVALMVALAFSLTAFDTISWLPFVLTDLLYTAIVLAAFVVVMRGLVAAKRDGRRRVLLAALLLLCFIARPAGVILIPVVIFIEIFAAKSRRLAPLLVVVGAALLVMVVRACFFDDMSRWPSDFMRPKLEEYAAREDTGEVVWGRKESFHQPPRSIADHFLIESDRFFRFFQFLSTGFSRMHNLLSAAYYIPLYLLGLAGLTFGLRSRDPRMRTAVVAIGVWIAATAWFHAITILDYDWRYRVPVLPVLIVLAAIGADALYARLRRQPWPAR